MALMMIGVYFVARISDLKRKTDFMAGAKTTIAVIGSGAAGLAAALAAAETGACRVLLLERAPESDHGGNTRWSPSYMRLAGVDRVEPSFVDDIEAVSAGRADRAYFERLAEEARPTIAWLKRHGVSFHKPIYYLSAGPPRIQPVGGGLAVLQVLRRAALEVSAEIRYECRAQALVTRDNGAVAGVEVMTKGGTSEIINADAVVLATGGFAGNSQMLKQHPGPGAEHLKRIAPGTAFNTGDGIRLALAAAARTSGDWARS
jgi:tricarballylate dehydrogenase